MVKDFSSRSAFVHVPVKLRTVSGIYSVARLAADAPIPGWFDGHGFSAAIRADDELTLVCPQDRVPDGIEAERGWRCFRSVGPIPFNATGIVRSLIEPLSSRGIGVFVVCTFDGEHVLVSANDWEKSRILLEQAGHVFEA
jgi:hypothetical protein